MDKNLLVVKEHLPHRCEICHQSDLFVAATGECVRCKDVPLMLPNNKINQTKQKNVKREKLLYLAGLVWFLVVFLAFVYRMITRGIVN